MIVYLLLGLTSLILTLILTPVIGRASARLGLVDAPGGRKVHANSVPRLGGVAVCLAAGLSFAITTVAVPGAFNAQNWLAIQPLILATGVIFLVGLIDDIRGLGAGAKLVFEFAAAAIVMSAGLLVEHITLFGMTWQIGWLAWPVTAAWLVGLTNAFNLIDGVDGLAAGIAGLAGTACATIMIMRGHVAEPMLLLAFVGAAAGFLRYNFAPATIFLGDSGSLVIGFLLAATAVTGWQKGATVLAAGVPLMIFALPIADSALALARRSLARPTNGRTIRAVLLQIAQPDREHIHHRMLAMGWSVRATVLILYAVTLVLCLLALATADLPT